MQVLPALMMFHHRVREALTPPVIYWLIFVGFFSAMFACAAWLIRRNHASSARRRILR
jgi:glucan phosphoethanolaminetransferase (alkaline phosphatase superfamily)